MTEYFHDCREEDDGSVWMEGHFLGLGICKSFISNTFLRINFCLFSGCYFSLRVLVSSDINNFLYRVAL